MCFMKKIKNELIKKEKRITYGIETRNATDLQRNNENCNEHYSQRKKEVENQDLVIRTLYFDLVTKAETISFLYENKKNDDIGMIFRSFIELYMYLKYILEKNTVNKARACFYWQKHQNIKILNNNLELMDSEEKQLALKEIDDSLRNSNNSYYDDLSTYKDYIEAQINSCYTNNISLGKRRNW